MVAKIDIVPWITVLITSGLYFVLYTDNIKPWIYEKTLNNPNLTISGIWTNDNMTIMVSATRNKANILEDGGGLAVWLRTL
jgi:hypothetical protein